MSPIGRFIASVATAMLLIMGVFTVGPWAETRFYPVYSTFKPVDMVALPNGDLSVTFRFTKYRICDPAGFAWYKGDLGASIQRMTVTFPDAPAPRPIGTHVSLPYIMEQTKPEELANGVFAEVYSRCHAFWTTRSVVYP